MPRPAILECAVGWFWIGISFFDGSIEGGAALTERAAHDDDRLEHRQDLWKKRQQQRDVGQRRGCDEVDPSSLTGGGGDALKHDRRRLARERAAPRGREERAAGGAVEAARAVDLGAVRAAGAEKRPRRARDDVDGVERGCVQDGERVFGHERERLVAGDGRDAEELEARVVACKGRGGRGS